MQRKRCVFERWLKLKATHSSLMHSQDRKKKSGFEGAEGKGMDGLWLAWECPFLKLTHCFSVSLAPENTTYFPWPCRTVYRWAVWKKMWYWRITFTLCIMKDNREVTLLQSHETLNHGAYINLLYVWVMSILLSTISQTTTLSGGLTPLTSPYSASPKPRGVFTGFPLNTGHILDLYI